MSYEIIKPSVTLESITPNALQVIEKAGRTCYKSESQGDPGKFVLMIKKRGHMSVLEHAVAGMRFICDRGVTHELVRHRLAAYSQESTRYCDYAGDGRSSGVRVIEPPGLDDTQHAIWLEGVKASVHAYEQLREAGAKPQIARAALPICLKTEIVCTANFREWLHIFDLRCAPAAHPQIRGLMIQARQLLRQEAPAVFGDPEVRSNYART